MRLLGGLLLLGAALAVPSAAGATGDDGVELRVKASGAQEIQPPGGVDTDTRAVLRLRFANDLSSARFNLRVLDGQLITQAHLHCAPAGVNGPVVVFLDETAPSVGGPGGQDVDGLLNSGTLTNDDILDVDFAANPACGVAINNLASLLAAILEDRIYLNVHSEGFPAGVVRGQIFADVQTIEPDDEDD